MIVERGVLTLLLAAGIAPTTAAEHGSEKVQGTAGWLHISGAMREASCQLDMPSRRQAIDLPAVSANALLKPGDAAEPTPFSLRLTGCIRSAGSVMNTRNNTLAWSSQQPIVTLTFSAAADAQTPELFQVKGAEGIGLRLRDGQGNTLRPGERSTPLFATPGDNELMFTVTPERTPAALMANAYRATLDFQIHYQ